MSLFPKTDLVRLFRGLRGNIELKGQMALTMVAQEPLPDPSSEPPGQEFQRALVLVSAARGQIVGSKNELETSRKCDQERLAP
jgi:hypothetical protein